MASGFFLGGLAQGINNATDQIATAQRQQQLIQIEGLRIKNEQKNQQQNFYLKLREQAIGDLKNTVSALRDHNPGWTDAQIMSNQAVAHQVDMLSGFDKNLGLDPKDAQSILAGIVAQPGEIQLARQKAIATGAYGKEQAQTNEANARTRVLNQAAGVGPNGQPVTNPDLDTDTQLGGKQFKTTGNPKVDSVIKGVDDGNLPPVVSGNVSYKDRTAFASGIEANGINLAQKQLQWKQAEKQVQSLNGPQMERYVGLNTSVQNTVDEVLSLSNKMKLSGVPALNSLELQKYIQTQGNSEQGQLATQYLTAVNTLKEEFANLAQGGYAPTDAAWKLADQQINGNYGWQQLPASLTEVKKLVNIRLHAIPGMNAVGPGSANPYTGTGKSQADDPLGLLK